MRLARWSAHQPLRRIGVPAALRTCPPPLLADGAAAACAWLRRLRVELASPI